MIQTANFQSEFSYTKLGVFRSLVFIFLFILEKLQEDILKPVGFSSILLILIHLPAVFHLIKHLCEFETKLKNIRG
jgi:hypothetical protein